MMVRNLEQMRRTTKPREQLLPMIRSEKKREFSASVRDDR
jgi:hypothetical protein